MEIIFLSWAFFQGRSSKRKQIKFEGPLIVYLDPSSPHQNRKKKHVNFGPPLTKIVSEYDQEIPQSQTADNPMAPRGRTAQPPRDTRKTN